MKLQKFNEVTEMMKSKFQHSTFNIQHFKFYLLNFTLLLLAGCSASGVLSLAELAGTTTVSDTAEQILKQQPDFQTMNASRIGLSVKFGKTSHNVRGSLRMYRDSVIQISIQPLPGIELFRAQLTPDSIFVLDRLKNEFMRADYNFIRTRFGVEADFYTLQSLFSNQLFLTGRRYLYSSDFDYFRLNPFPDGYILETKSKDFAYDHEFVANRAFRIEQTTLTHRLEPYFLKFEYSELAEFEKMIFPSKMQITLFDGQTSNFLTITINSVDFNKAGNVSFSIPRKYKEITIK